MSRLAPAMGVGLLKQQIHRGRELLQHSSFHSQGYFAWEEATHEVLNSCFDIISGTSARFSAIGNDGFSVIGEDSTPAHKDSLKKQLVFLETAVEILEAEVGTLPDSTARFKTTKEDRIINNDPFKRRYQVFVSSTYEDLKEERRHVMQALLETKCIPTGMELFPAASEEQWELIRRVIDDCDYYVLVVAGRYGSLGPNGKSFTEMEFDYAVSSGTYVIALYHADIGTLPFNKVEKSDVGRQRLDEFTGKLKTARVCKSWTTPEGLASAIKSAIFYAIENHPRPGWVRARDLAPPAAIAKLRASIDQHGLTLGDETVDLPANIGYNEVDNPNEGYQWSSRSSFPHTIRRTWNQIFLTLAPRLNERKNRRALKIIFENQLAPSVEALVPRKPRKHVINCECSLNAAAFEKVLDTFVAQRLFRVVEPPKDVRTKVPYWEITAKGRQRLAELRASADAV